MGNLAEAIKHFHAAVQMRPHEPTWQFNYGLALQHLKQLPNAIAAYRKAVQLKPDFFDAWSNLSAALKAAGQANEAVAAGRHAVKLAPNSGGAHLNLGNALKAAGDWTAAEAAYRRALILEPNNPRIRLNLANTLRELGRLPEAIALLRQAVERSPNFPEAHRDLAFALMLSGDLRPGWIENEWRWQTEDMIKKRRSFEAPAWSGEDLPGRTILAYTEQGFGDAFQFVRYVDLLAQRGARVILECQLVLKRLFETVRGVSEVIARGEPVPRVDFQAPLLSLPRVFETTLETIPRETPYIKAPAAASNELPAFGGESFKVGLVWAGNPDHLNDQNRSIPLALLRPLLNLEGFQCPEDSLLPHERPPLPSYGHPLPLRGGEGTGEGAVQGDNVRITSENSHPEGKADLQVRRAFKVSPAFYSLQVGERASELKRESGLSHVIDLSPHLRDFATTAAAIERMDLVVSVDTSVAHLAGALGKPVWLLLPFAPDWRWMLGRDDSPWYPTMRLFRQNQIGDWTTVVVRLCAELGTVRHHRDHPH